MKNKKAQMTLGDAPNVVLIVALTFLVMATLAFIASKYGAAIPSDETASAINETLTTVTEAGEYVAAYDECNFEDFSVSYVTNATNTLVPATNYTIGTDGKISAKGSPWNNTNWKITYSYSYAGVACNVTNDLNTEIANNTSIAGIVLTISLVGIVLTVLIGIFVIARNRGM